MQQIITAEYRELEFLLNRRATTINLEIQLTSRAPAHMRFALNGQPYDVEFQNDQLIRHLFFTDGRSIANVQMAGRVIRLGGLTDHREIIEWDDLELSVGGAPFIIHPTTTITPRTIEVAFRIGRRRFTIQSANLPLFRHIGATTGNLAEYSLRGRRF
jgi:hypothetical protein